MKDFFVLVSSDIYDQHIDYFKNNFNCHWLRIDFQKKPHNYNDLLEKAICLISRDDLSDDEYSIAKNLRLIQIPIAGYNQIDLKKAKRNNIYVCNNGGANAISVAEHVFLLILALYRQFIFHNRSIMQGPWKNRKYSNIEIFNKTIGIIGLGNCGLEVAKRAAVFGMKVVYYDIFRKDNELEKKLSLQFLPYHKLLSVSDIVTYHVPLTNETKGMINTKILSMMKPQSIIINTARGEIQIEEDLFNALVDNKIKGAGLDVFAKEPLDRDSKLLTLDNIVLTPHCAPSYESTFRVREYILSNVKKVCSNQSPDFIVVDYDK